MPVVRVRPDVVDPNVHETGGDGLPQQALPERAFEDPREEREHVRAKTHGVVSPGTSRTMTTPVATSTDDTTSFSAGMRVSPFSERATQTSFASVRRISLMMPSGVPASVRTSQPTSSCGQYSPSGNGGTSEAGTTR